MNKQDIQDHIIHAKWRIRNGYWRFSNFVRDQGGAFVDWVANHPTETIAFIGLGISGVKASQSLVVNHRINKANKRADRTYFDPSTHFRWDLKRKMTNNDRAYISTKKREGVDMYDILKDRNLI